MNIEVIKRTIYGKHRFYPLNDDTQTILSLMGNKTFTEDQLRLCLSAGWTVDIKTEQYELNSSEKIGKMKWI